MNRFDGVEEKVLYQLLDRMFAKEDFWFGGFPEKIGFQRFGLQLREEDFEQEGVSYRGFNLRDRNETRKSNSGYSIVNNCKEEFKIELDVWPFKRDELAVMLVPGKYFTVKGEHEEKFEDNSECTRKFQRYYCLPRGSNSSTIKCSYRSGILAIRVDKETVPDEMQGPQTVPINLVTYKENRGMPIEEQYTPAVPLETRVVPIASDNLDDNGKFIQTVSPEEVPVINGDLQSSIAQALNKVESLRVLVSSLDLKDARVASALKSIEEALCVNEESKSENVAVKIATEFPAKKTVADNAKIVNQLLENVDRKSLTSENGE